MEVVKQRRFGREIYEREREMYLGSTTHCCRSTSSVAPASPAVGA
jgi:hypothetical protein